MTIPQTSVFDVKYYENHMLIQGILSKLRGGVKEVVSIYGWMD